MENDLELPPDSQNPVRMKLLLLRAGLRHVHSMPVRAASLLILLLAVSCSRQAAEPGRNPRAGNPVPVLTATAVAKDVPVEIHAIGNALAYSSVAIRSQITGPIVGVHFEEGQEVKTGDLLFTIDPRPWQAALNQAQANLKRDEAQMQSAILEFQRTSNLFAGRIASRQDYDTAEAGYLALLGTALADAAAISNAQVSLDYTSIRSPIDGRTGGWIVKKGNVVKAPDDVLLTITQVHPIFVAFSVAEQQLPAIRRESSQASLAVTAVVPGQAGDPARGRLTFINNTVDTNTGTILLKAVFANTNDVLWPGQFVQVTLTLKNREQATTIPTQAVQTGPEGEFVFVVKADSTVEMRPVVTSGAMDGATLIDSGVSPGETVVTDGQLRLVPGGKVSIKAPEPAGLPPKRAAAGL
jgi:multidrug efflux system membrane fusion protein